jgi:hypothetical protein
LLTIKEKYKCFAKRKSSLKMFYLTSRLRSEKLFKLKLEGKFKSKSVISFLSELSKSCKKT